EGAAGHIVSRSGGIAQGADFGMRAAGTLRGAPAENLAVAHDDASDTWVGRGEGHDACGKRQRLTHPCHILFGKVRSHCQYSLSGDPAPSGKAGGKGSRSTARLLGRRRIRADMRHQVNCWRLSVKYGLAIGVGYFSQSHNKCYVKCTSVPNGARNGMTVHPPPGHDLAGRKCLMKG